MDVIYADTSAVGKLLLHEPESAALTAFLVAEQPRLVSTDLLETELRRVAVREEIGQAAVVAPRLDHPVRVAAQRISRSRPTSGRTIDALHLIGALRLRVAGVLTHEERVADAVLSLGLRIYSPAP